MHFGGHIVRSSRAQVLKLQGLKTQVLKTQVLKTPKHTICRWGKLQPHYACLGVPNPLPPSTHTYAT